MNTDILLDVLIVALHKTSCFGRNVTLKERGTQGRESRMKTELKPCPFCGGEARIACDCSIDKWEIFCGQCHCTLKMFAEREDAVIAWNTRKGEK